MWLGIIALAFAVSALCFCAFLWLELREKLSKADIRSELQQSCDELNKTSERSVRALEAEWADMYSKFMRLAGRMDKTKGLDDARALPPATEAPRVMRRSDLLRNRNGRGNHVEDVSA